MGVSAMETKTLEIWINRNLEDTGKRLGHKIEALMKEGRTIVEIHVPSSVAIDLGFTDDPGIKNGYLYGDHRAVQKKPSDTVSIVFK